MTHRNDVLEREPVEIAQQAEGIGAARLDRSSLEILVTSVIGGGEVSLGGLASMTVVGAVLQILPGSDLYAALALAGLVFPIGFLFVIIGRSELFTENFLIPVVAVFKTERTLGSLLTLWALSWIGNIVGCAATSALLLVPEAIGSTIHNGYAVYTDYKLSLAPIGVFASALLAGGVMTALTWLLLSVEHPVARMISICAAAYVLMAANLSHSIVSASVLLVGFVATRHSFFDVVGWLAIATLGNLVGGVGLVTLFRLAQVHEQS